MRKLATTAALCLLAAGCYHSVVNTGLAPSGQTSTKPWAHGFLFGLVPPSPVEIASKCPNGVAKVETQLSVANQLAAMVTSGIYTPMTIAVECAAAPRRSSIGSDGDLQLSGDRAKATEIVSRAIVLSAEQRKAVYIHLN